MNNVRKILKSIWEYLENTQILLSGLIKREDGHYSNEVYKVNTNMAAYSEGSGIVFINGENIGVINRGRLHLTIKG